MCALVDLKIIIILPNLIRINVSISFHTVWFISLHPQIFRTKMKNELQPTRATFSRNSHCKRAPQCICISKKATGWGLDVWLRIEIRLQYNTLELRDSALTLNFRQAE